MKRNLIIVLLSLILVPLTMDGAKKKSVTKPKVDPATVLEKAREAFLDYRFDEAAEFYDEYRDLMAKAKEELPEEVEIEEQRLEIASNAFERVEKITVLDSLSLPREKFYEAYRLSSPTGKIVRAGALKSKPRNIDANTVGFVSEDGDRIIWSGKNKDGFLILKESLRLLDGEWMTKDLFQEDFEIDGNYAYPFLASDGQTLYFANDGSNSMGGYDLFVAQRDATTGDFLQPLNLGMPFNSPSDDILLAADEIQGVGWWATDRNSADGKVTVYVYLLNDLRENYPSTTENLSDYARITDYRKTQDPAKGAQYRTLLQQIRK